MSGIAYQNPSGEKVERECPACGVTYLAEPVRLKHGRQTACGRACSYKIRAAKKKNRVDVTCATCGKEISRSPSHMKSKHGSQFCSRRCHYVGRTLGLSKRVVTKPYQYTDEGMRALSRAGARAYAAGKTLAHPESELAFCDFLAEREIPFTHQQVFDMRDRSIVVDFYFPALATVIELDGPEHQTAGAEADANRDAFLLGLGIRVVRVPDVGETDDVCRAAILALVPEPT